MFNSNIYIFLFFYFLVLIDTEPSAIHFIRPKRDTTFQKGSLNNLQTPFIKDANLFICSSADYCQKIEEFTIADNYTFNCYELYLPINFYPRNERQKKTSIFGYLPLQGSQITDLQKYTDECRKVRRYILKIFIN